VGPPRGVQRATGYRLWFARSECVVRYSISWKMTPFAPRMTLGDTGGALYDKQWMHVAASHFPSQAHLTPR